MHKHTHAHIHAQHPCMPTYTHACTHAESQKLKPLDRTLHALGSRVEPPPEVLRFASRLASSTLWLASTTPCCNDYPPREGCTAAADTAPPGVRTTQQGASAPGAVCDAGGPRYAELRSALTSMRRQDHGFVQLHHLPFHRTNDLASKTVVRHVPLWRGKARMQGAHVDEVAVRGLPGGAPPCQLCVALVPVVCQCRSGDTSSRRHASAHVHACALYVVTCARTRAHTRMDTRTHSHTCTRARKHAYTHVRAHTDMLALGQVRACQAPDQLHLGAEHAQKLPVRRLPT